MWSRLRRYAAELRLCAALGADAESQARLMRDTCRFHLANRLGGRPGPARPYAVDLIGGRHDLWLRPNSGDFFILHEIFLDEPYAVPSDWRAGVETIVDLGANIGLATLFLNRCFPRARFICVEPDPANARLLQDNLSPLIGRATVVEGAASDRPGEGAFDDGGQTWGGRLVEGGGRPVRCYGMDELLARTPGRIDLLKVDIEGAEARLFAAPGAWIERVGAILIELHPPYGLEQFERDMGRAGFRVLRPGQARGLNMVAALRGAR